MPERAVYGNRIAPSARAASAVSALFVYDSDRDGPGVLLPRPEIHLVARFGPSERGGLDVHALGIRQEVHRKRIPGGHGLVMARLRLGAQDAVLGVPASAVAGRIVALADLWGGAVMRRLCERLAGARDRAAAAAVLSGAIEERLATADLDAGGVHAPLVRAAAGRLTSASVSAVAADLGVSERHLRRVFHETAFVGPKAFARLTRFRRALRAARADARASWASIVAAAGYYDQGHLIAEFRAIAGVTPRALLCEIRAAASFG